MSNTTQQPSEQVRRELKALCIQLNKDSEGPTAILDEWFTIEYSEIVKLNEVDMIFREVRASYISVDN